MQQKNWVMLVIVAMQIIAIICSVVYLGKGNPVEIQLEKAIELETGIKVDLTP